MLVLTGQTDRPKLNIKPDPHCVLRALAYGTCSRQFDPCHGIIADETEKGENKPRTSTECDFGSVSFALPLPLIRAGYADTCAAAEASRLLRNAKVADAIDGAMAQRAGITRTFIIDELAKIARANAGDFFEWGPDGVTVKASADLDDEQCGVVAEVSQTVTQHGGSIRIKLSDKQAALEKLGRALGMFGDRVVIGELMEEVAELRRMLAARRAADNADGDPELPQDRVLQ